MTAEPYFEVGLPEPQPTTLDAPYWAAARRSELVVQRCVACGGFQWAPEWTCHRCHSFDLGFVPVRPAGTVYTWTRVWHPLRAGLQDQVPYLVVAVSIDDAPDIKMIGNLIGDPAQDVHGGLPVRAVFEHHEAFTLVQWRAAGSPGASPAG